MFLVHVYVNMYLWKYMHVNVYVNIYICVRFMHVCSSGPQAVACSRCAQGVCVPLHACMYKYIRV